MSRSSGMPFSRTLLPTKEPAIINAATIRSRPLSRPSDTSWLNPKVLTIFALIFLCGATCGAVLVRAMLHPKQASKIVGLKEFKQELKLTPDQEKVVTEVLDDYGKYYQNLEQDRQDVAMHGKQRILDALRPDQKLRFERMFDVSALPVRPDGQR